MSQPTTARNNLADQQVSRGACREADEALVAVHAVNSAAHRSSAQILVNRMYARRGYSTVENPAPAEGERLTLIGEVAGVTIGTIGIGFDGPSGLLADACFGELVASLRGRGYRLCEFVKLAIDNAPHSRRVLASLFHSALIVAQEVRPSDKIIIEVNPRHVPFYRSMLGFSVLGSERLNTRVNAPAVLLGLEVAAAVKEINEVHASASPGAARARSMYRYSLSDEQRSGILSAMQLTNRR